MADFTTANIAAGHRYPVVTARLVAALVRLGAAATLGLLAMAFASVRAADTGASITAEAERISPLAAHVSPYLRGHAGDPVAWHVWGDEALAQAREQGKLILVSVGYFACHWCHVMQRETFQDPASAAAINAATVPIKIDRELRPALDAHLIDFVERTTGRAGWPLNIILTPDGLPLVGFTYLRTPDFDRVLENVRARWDAEPDTLHDLAKRADVRLRELRRPAGRLQVDASAARDLLRRLFDQLMTAADSVHGGFGEQAKFPSVPQLAALLTMPVDVDSAVDTRRVEFLHLTLSRMASLGLRDQVGGGFFRYTTEVDWATPHYEKMLYDNALLASLYADAAGVLAEPAYRRLADDTLAFMMRELWDPRGAFIASLSAVDVDDVEGGFYMLAPEALAALPQDLRQLVSNLWGLNDGADRFPLQRQPLDAVAAALGRPVLHLRADLERARLALVQRRDTTRLPRDDKLLSGWNGLALSALVRSRRPEFETAARKLATTLSTRMWNGQRLARALHGNDAAGAASLQDYAYVAAGLLDAAQRWRDASLMQTAVRIVETGWTLHFDAGANGGWTRAPADVIALAQPVTALSDRSRPAASAVLLETTRRMLAEPGVRSRLGEQFALATSVADLELAETPFFYASHIVALARRYELDAMTER
ncbi:MAG: DUF255 domain-containing protein [Pseudomonadota bacterium]